jgi:transposase
MQNVDTRKLPPSAVEEKRFQAIGLRRKGLTRMEIGRIVGVHADTVGRWLKIYQAVGAQGLKLKKRGRRQGGGRKLDADQEQFVRKLLLDKTPDQLKMPNSLWTRESIKELLNIRLGVNLPIRTLGHYLKRWELIPQKPLQLLDKQLSTRVQAWLDQEYPQIHAQAKEQRAEIYWVNETRLNTDYLDKLGNTPDVKPHRPDLNSNRESVNMISAITNKGKAHFMLLKGEINSVALIDFMNRVIKDAQRKVILILHNPQVSHTDEVKEWLIDKDEEIALYHLPSFSPDFKPDI